AGIMLQEASSTEFLHKGERVALRPGVSWSESQRGNNAIGTALFEGAPIRVHGSEHFLSCNRILSCHAAPIRSPRGDVIGVLDISGDAATLHAYRSEEHTSELQSRENLVCRLLLEKKKK